MDSRHKYSDLSEVKVYFPHIKILQSWRSRASGEFCISKVMLLIFISQPLGKKEDKITLKDVCTQVEHIAVSYNLICPELSHMSITSYRRLCEIHFVYRESCVQ